MKVEIDYYLSKLTEAPIGARTEYRGEGIYALGKDDKEAKEKLLAKLKTIMAINLPKREIVELEEPEPDQEELPGVLIVENDIPDGLENPEKFSF